MTRSSVIVLGAGGPAGWNVADAAQAHGYDVIGIDSDPAHLPLAQKVCSTTLSVPGIPNLAVNSGILVLAQPEKLVLEAAERDDVFTHTPRPEVIKLTQSKRHTLAALGRPHLVIGDPHQDWLHLAADKFGLPFWLRANRGAGGLGAIKIDDLRAAHHWIRLHDVIGKDFEWIAEEYLPGRDFCWTGLFHEGELYASFTRERLEWLYPFLTPTGKTCTPTMARVVHYPMANFIAPAKVRRLDPEPHGVYCVDMVENKIGSLRVTEINAGRWATTSPLYRDLGPNLVGMQIDLAYGLPVEKLGSDVYPEVTLNRHIDAGRTWS